MHECNPRKVDLKKRLSKASQSGRQRTGEKERKDRGRHAEGVYDYKRKR